jgi:hypothetical protein
MSEVHGALKMARKSEPIGRAEPGGFMLGFGRLLASMRDPDLFRRPEYEDDDEDIDVPADAASGRLYGTLLSRSFSSESPSSDGSGGRLRGRLLQREE